MSDACHPVKSAVQPDKDKLISRLNRIEGQVRGVSKMVNEDRYCVDIITQISAIKSAVDSIAMQILENHMHGCVNRAIAEGECEETIDELMKVMKMLSGKALK